MTLTFPPNEEEFPKIEVENKSYACMIFSYPRVKSLAAKRKVQSLTPQFLRDLVLFTAGGWGGREEEQKEIEDYCHLSGQDKLRANY